MSEKQPEILWCMHVRGPDDVVPAPDYETAARWCDVFNARFSTFRGLEHEYDPHLSAYPAPWPWSAADHADYDMASGEYAWCAAAPVAE